MPSRRILTLSPDSEQLWVRLYVREIEGLWAAMIVGEDELPPAPSQLKGIAFFGATREGAEREALVYLGASEPAN
jgi:hypothetical protein